MCWPLVGEVLEIIRRRKGTNQNLGNWEPRSSAAPSAQVWTPALERAPRIEQERFWTQATLKCRSLLSSVRKSMTKNKKEAEHPFFCLFLSLLSHFLSFPSSRITHKCIFIILYYRLSLLTPY